MNRLLYKKPDPKKKQKILENIAKLNNKNNNNNIDYKENKKLTQENTKKRFEILKKKT